MSVPIKCYYYWNNRYRHLFIYQLDANLNRYRRCAYRTLPTHLSDAGLRYYALDAISEQLAVLAREERTFATLRSAVAAVDVDFFVPVCLFGGPRAEVTSAGVR